MRCARAMRAVGATPVGGARRSCRLLIGVKVSRLLICWLVIGGLASYAGVGCGSNGGGMAPNDDVVPPDPDRPAEAGAVRLANQTSYAIQSAYLHVDDDGERIVRVDVAAGGEAMISDGALPAGATVEFDLVLQVPASEGLRVRRKAQVTVDGDTIVNATLGDDTDPFSLVVAGV